jgi:zinc-binding alcohol dehydrogenase/oxidoreductase
MSETMLAVRLHEIGGPQNLRVEEIPRPEPAGGDVLVRVRAAAFNRRDVFIAQGLYPGIKLPVTLGSDGAGVLESTGAEVVIDPMIGWGADERAWDVTTYNLLGMPRDGTFAQYVCVPAGNVYPKPASLSMEAAAAIPLAGLTAYRAVFTRAALAPGETILIPGIGGGVQTFVLLFAKKIGARAIVTSGDDAKLERAKAMGADLCLNYKTTPDWQKEAKAAGVDVAVDSSGGDTLAKTLDAIRPGGRIAVYGGTTPNATIKLFPLFWKHVTILGTSMGSPADFRSMLALFDGTIEPAIDRVFPMAGAVEAAQRMNSSAQFGKIVLAIP